MSNPRIRTLTDKGMEFLESKLREKCASALRAANTIANKLNPLLNEADATDIELVKQYNDKFQDRVTQVTDSHMEYIDTFAGDLDKIANFNDWFNPRLEILTKLQQYATEWISRNAGLMEPPGNIANNDIKSEDSVSQVPSAKSRSASGSRTSKSASTHKSRSSNHSSKHSSVNSVKSARIKESLKKLTLIAEATNLAKRQDLLRKELELSMEKETLELSTKLAIASAKEEVLLEAGSSDASVSGSSKLGQEFISHTTGMIDDGDPIPSLSRLSSGSEVKTSASLALGASPELKYSRFRNRFVNFSESYETPRLSVHTFAETSRTNVPDLHQQNTDQGDSLVSSTTGIVHTSSKTSEVTTEHLRQSDITTSSSYANGSIMSAVPHDPVSSTIPFQTQSMLPEVNTGVSSMPYVSLHNRLDPSSPAFVPRKSAPLATSNSYQDPVVGTQVNGAGCFEDTHVRNPGSYNHNGVYQTGISAESEQGIAGRIVQSDTSADFGNEPKFDAVMVRLTDVLKDQRVKLPEVTIAKFSGDPLEYTTFIRSFDSRIASRTNDDSERIYYLEQYTSGIPRELVRSCMHMPTWMAYKEARNRLDKRFGDPFLLAQSYLKKLEAWTPIRSDDVKRLDEFTTFLIGCHNATTYTSSIGELDYPSSLRLIVSKLPVYLQDRWSRQADIILYQEGNSVTFSRLVSFLERETRIKLNPLFGKVALFDRNKNASDRNKGGSSQSKKNVTSAATAVSPETNANSNSSSHNACLFCGFQHAFNVCRKFQKILHRDKIVFLKKHRRCFGCLSGDHMRSDCHQTLTCGTCGGSHHTLLHRSPSGTDNDGTSASDSTSVKNTVSNSGSSTVVHTVTSAAIKNTRRDVNTMPNIPVRLKLALSDKEVCTHAFLDSGSSDTFITEHLLRQLGVNGKKKTINVTTLNNDNMLTSCYAISNLEVSGLHEECFVPLPTVYTQESLPVSREQIPLQQDIDCWPYLSHIRIPSLDADVGILIGSNVPKATEPWEVVNSVGDGPYAVRSLLGWSINGPLRGVSVHDDQIPMVSVNRIEVDSGLENQLQRFFNQDFNEQHVFSGERSLSVEDQQFLEMVERKTILSNGHYEICLPLRDASVPMPNNRPVAMQSLKRLARKFKANESYKKKYSDFVEDLFVKGHASQVPKDELVRSDGSLWYLPHHGVIHPRKDKLRVVFDASDKFGGTSLNDRLLSGPDLSNSLVGVLIRFRQERVAFMADLECMFYQVKVPVEQRDLLRFLWWPKGDVEKQVIECRMHAHIFGATSSPAVAKYAIRRTALDNAASVSAEAVDTVNRSFYVDDCLKSVVLPVKDAISLASELRTLTQKGGFRLRQWVSNNRELLNSVPESERAKNVKEVDLDYEELPLEKALGVLWVVETDSLGFQINVLEKPATRRGVLSIVSSVFDPLGMVAPFVLTGKMIVQELCRMKLGWDDFMPDDIGSRWQQWLCSLPSLNQFSIPRCFVPEDFGKLTSVVLHHFADASEFGYGCVSYLRFVNEDGQVHCAFAFGRARVAPLKQMTIPRMELAAAVLAVKVETQLRCELDLPLDDSYFWSDSTSVLGYIKNETTRFHIFAANRVALIRECSSPSQWNYVPTHENPADDCTRGLDGEALVECVRWRDGPSFLWKSEAEWPVQSNLLHVDHKDPEVKKAPVVCAVQKNEISDTLLRIMQHFSSWYKLKRFVALMSRAVTGLKCSMLGQKVVPDPPTVPLCASDLMKAEIIIISWAQQQTYSKEIRMLSAGTFDDLKSSKLAPLNPILVNGMLRVGGRIRNAPVSDDLKHPVIIPPDSPIALLIIRDIHCQIGHGGRDQVLSRVREKYWIVHGNALTRQVLRACIFCRQRFGSPLSQKMADLPVDRISPDLPPFTNTGVDYFGPLLVKQGRSQVKRYGALFTCLISRAVHIEMAASLETDAFVNALRRFIARRGQVQIIRSDNGTNFVGAVRELRDAVHGWNTAHIETFLLQRNITWIFNAPGASHHGGSWERLIRSTRRVMMGLIKEQTLTDDGLVTLLAEVEAVLNGRPLTRTSSDPDDLNCLTPNHLLLLKDQQSLPPCTTSKDDNYVRRRWRQIQYMSDIFWKRWIHEYLPLLQERQRWLYPNRNVQIGDIVLVVDQNAPRGSWPRGRVQAVFPDGKGLIRNVEIKTKSSKLIRPVTKLVMVLECDE